ncbi:hypothetical protein BH11ACT8_BH11ACT8_26760 [soil metagenome]
MNDVPGLTDLPEHVPDTVLHVGGASPYDVIIGHHLADHLPVLLGDALRVAIVCPDALTELVDEIVESLGDRDVTVLAVPDGEEAKTAEFANACW